MSNVNLGWLDGDRTSTSRALLAAVTADGSFRLAQVATGYAELDDALLRGRIDVALVVPPGFERNLARREAVTVTVQALADGTDAIMSARAIGNLSAQAAALGVRLMPLTPRVDVCTRAWYNADLKSLRGMVPGLLAIVLYLAVVKLFDVPMRGSFTLLLACSLFFVAVDIGYGVVISSFAHTQQQAILYVFMLAMLDVALSGYLVPVKNMPSIFRVVAAASPLQHYLVIVRAIMLKGAGLAVIGVGVGVLAMRTTTRSLE